MHNLPEIKIMIIGPREAGRSLLAQRLSGQEEKGKDAIEIYECTVDYQDQRYQLQVWDFSGREILHATHQLFFTPKSLYILVDDTRASEKYIQDEYYKYWFEVVKRYGKESLMIIVQNEKGGRSKEIATEDIQDLYPFFKGAYPLDLKECRDEEINALRENILRLGQQVVQIFETFTLDEFRSSIESQRRSKINHLKVEDFRTLCNNHCVSDKYHFDKVLEQLHNMGIVFHFKQFESLANWVILNPNWLVKSIYKILDSETVERQDGRFTLRDVRQILYSAEYNGTHDRVIGLMEKFYRCYGVGDDTWMAPQLFKPKPIKLGEWSKKPYIKEQKAEFEFLPKGLVEELLVKSYSHINLIEPWLGGFCFEKYDTRLIVVEQWTEKTILFRYVDGDQIPQAACFIQEMLKEVSKVAKVGFYLWVPCTCSSCKNSHLPSLYRYEEDLLRRKENDHRVIECSISYEKVLIDDILQSNIEYLPPIPQTTNYKLPPKTMKGLIGTLIILLAVLAGLYWFFTHTKADTTVRLELPGVKVEGKQGGEPAPDKNVPEAVTAARCTVTGRVMFGTRPAKTIQVYNVIFRNEPTRGVPIGDGGIYTFYDFPYPKNEIATLEVYLKGVDDPLIKTINRFSDGDGKEVKYQDAIFEGSYNEITKKTTVIYNGQTLIINGNGNAVNQTMQKGDNNSSTTQQGVPKLDNTQKKE